MPHIKNSYCGHRHVDGNSRLYCLYFWIIWFGSLLLGRPSLSEKGFYIRLLNYNIKEIITIKFLLKSNWKLSVYLATVL